MQKKKILLIEDEDRIANILKKGLEEFNYTVTIAENGEEAKNNIANNSFDLIITDVILPVINGIELCKIIKTQNPVTPIVMLTALGTTDDKLEGFDAGADDYMVKPIDLRELNARINALLKRTEDKRNNETIQQAQELVYHDLRLDLNSKVVRRQNKIVKLTPKEFALLKYLMQNSENVLSRAEIAEKVWNTHFDTGTNFIDVYINYLRTKIDKGFEEKYIHTRAGLGFVLINEI